MVRASLVRCSCISHGCHNGSSGYTELSRPTQQKHREDDLELSLRKLSVNDSTHIVTNNGNLEATTSIATVDNDKTDDFLSMFISIIDEYQLRMRSLTCLAEAVEVQPESILLQENENMVTMRGHISWMTATMCNLKSLSVGTNDSLDRQRDMLVQILREKLDNIRRWEESRYDAVLMNEKCEQTNAFKNDMISFRHRLSMSHPLVLLSMFITVVLNVIDGLPERSSNFLLRMHRDLLKLAILSQNKDRGFIDERTFILKNLPKDIRTVRSQFGLEPQIEIFAACPKCSTLFKPKFDAARGFDVYSVAYCNQRELDGTECGASLLKWQVRGKKAIRVPCRPYGYFKLRDFVGEMLSRPGLEDLLERRPSATNPAVLEDIFDGRIIRDFRGRDGLPCFRKNGEHSDLYLAWAINVDWFNPYHNKIAGKTVSVGAISMVCLNLPLRVRYEITNMYLVGIIPGPQEPSLHKVNHFLAPIIDDFSKSWYSGIQYSKTYKHPNGRTVYCILIPLVADLPASRKVSGTTAHNSRCFCPLCLRKKEEINNISVSFDRRTREEHVRLAKEWRDTQSHSQRVALAKKNGIRYSVFFNLPYWESRFIVVDAMHNLFLGLIQHHFRVIIGIDFEASSKAKGLGRSSGRSSGASKEGRGRRINPKKMSKILDLLMDAQGPTPSRLKRYSINSLIDFHIWQKIPLYLEDGKYTKDGLVLSLLDSSLVKKDRSSNATGAGTEHVRTEELDLDALPFVSSDDTSILEFFAAGVSYTATNQRVKVKSSLKKVNYIGHREIEAIQVAIRSTCRPSWQQSPPKTFGTSQQGKIKADQWRTLLEFDLPVALVELWVDSDGSDSNVDTAMEKRRLALVDTTMELAAAVFWGTSRKTSSRHAAKYVMHIQRYLQGIQKLTPKPKLVPNHHSALHIGEQLLFFGPVNNWWTYPYERLIGSLQKISTNYSIGEMELSMLKSYHASAQLQRVLNGNECPTILRSHLTTLNEYLPTHAVGSYGSNVHQEDDSSGASKQKIIERLDDDIYNAICSLRVECEKPNREFIVHNAYIVDGCKFTSLESERDSILFYDSDTGRSPGVVRKIFSLANGVVLFAVHSYAKLEGGISDPFMQWPEFRAGLWSQRVDEQVKLIDPNKTYICHAARRPWKDKEIYVFRPLDRNYSFTDGDKV